MTISKISIIIPIYNVEKYLSKCLDSVITQTFKDIEIICVNDGSTDNSLAILEEYAQKDNRIKIINRKNGGLSAARNSGLDAVTGEYVYFIDSDDWIELNTIDRLGKIINAYDVDAVIHGANNILEDSSFIGTNLDAQAWFDSYAQNNGIYDVPMEIKKFICPVAWNKLYKMDIINKYHCRFLEGFINEDELFLWTYMIHCKNYYYLDEKLYNYLRRSDSIMGTRDNSPKILDILKIQEEIYKTVKKYKNIEDYQEYLTQNYVDEIKWIFPRMPEKYHKKALKKIKKYYKYTNHDRTILELYEDYKPEHTKKIMETIFSVKDINEINYVGKQIKLFGLKFKFKNKYKTLLNKINSLQNQINYADDKINKLYHTSRMIANTEIIPNKIVFNNMTGKGYGCNPKYIAEEIIHQNLPYELVWLVSDVEKVKAEFPKEIRLVEYNVENSIREFASAKVWISNQRMPQLYENGLFKKKGQYYIQTWHGWTPIKQIEKDIETEKQWWCKWAKIDSQYIDLLTCSSKFDKNRLSQCFYYCGEISDVGIPRNDIFFNNKEQNIVINKVYTTFNIPSENKILLYAPTFRDDDRLDCYDIDIKSCVSVLEEKYNTKFSVITRLHPNVQEKAKDVFKFKDYIDATDYPDVMELLLASDVMITDYSCLMFEFMQTRKPVFLYGCDLDKYLKERNFYIDIKSLFFPFAETNEQLVQNIQNFDREEYLSDVEKFIEESGSKDDGKASEYIVGKIRKVVGYDK